MWSKSSSPRQDHSPGQAQPCAHWVVPGCSWVGARMGSTTGLARGTRRWLQRYLPKDLSGRDTTSSMLSSWICCVKMFSSCGLLLCSHSVLMVLSHWELWWNTNLWEPWLTALFLRPTQEVQNEIQVWPKDWERQLCPSPQRCWISLALLNSKGQETSFKLHSYELLGFFFPHCNIEVELLNELWKTEFSAQYGKPLTEVKLYRKS